MTELRDTARRILVMLLVVFPVLATGGAVFDFLVSSPNRPAFVGVLTADLALVYVFGLAPGLIACLAHTELTRRREIANETSPRARSALYGGAIGLGAGFGLGLVISMVAASLVPWRVVLPMLWGVLGGVLYGFLVGPAVRSGGRAA
jgi:hypothetical protein